MKQILFITPHFLPTKGGVEKHVSEVSKVLSKRGFAIRILTAQDNSDQPLHEKMSYCVIDRIPLEMLDSKKQIWNWIKNYFKKNTEESIINIHDVGWWLLPFLVSKFKNNFYITFHGWEGVYPVRWQAKLHRLFISVLAKKTIHVGKYIQQFYWDKPDIVLYGGVRSTGEITIHKAKKNNLSITFLGRLEKENSIESYLEVLTELVKKKCKVTVTWVGDGRLRHLCEKWGKVTGMVESTSSYLKNADFVFASSYLSILESQAQGRIVCSIYDTSLKKAYLETFPGRELLVLSSSPQEMADKIYANIEYPNHYISLSKKSRSFALEQTWEKVADRYEEIWGAE